MAYIMKWMEYFIYKFFLIIVTILVFSGCNKNNEAVKFYGNVDVRTVSLAFQVFG